jgi:hypothetical protein
MKRKVTSGSVSESDSDEDALLLPNDILQAAEIVQRTCKITRRLEEKYSGDSCDTTPDADDLAYLKSAMFLKQTATAQEKTLVKTAIRLWFKHNFPRPSSGDADVAGTQQNAEIRQLSRSKILEFLNMYLNRIGLPELTRRDPVWLWVCTEILGIKPAEVKSGVQVLVQDERTLDNFEQTLRQLLDAVRLERFRQQSPLLFSTHIVPTTTAAAASASSSSSSSNGSDSYSGSH